MSNKWDAITPEGQALSEPLTGPLMILSGRGCRLTLKTIENEERRNDNLLLRLHMAAVILARANVRGISSQPQEGYTRVNGGAQEVYVEGQTDQEIYTTLAQGILQAASEFKRELAKLEISSIVEW